MSIHVSPLASSFRSRLTDTPVSYSAGASLPAPVRPHRPADPLDEGFSVRLGHMGVVIAISAAARGLPAATMREIPASSDGADTIRLEVAPEGIRRCAGVLAGPALGTGTADPVVRLLSQALERAEHEEREFDGLYADALRLAIVTRLLSVPGGMDGPAGCTPRGGSVDDPEQLAPAAPAPMGEPATAPRRLKSGLPKWRLKRVTAYVEENLGEPITLADMASAAGLSRMHFAAQFRIATGMRPHEFLLRQRIEKAQQMLLGTRDPLVEIALCVGFQTQAHFTTVFRRFVGDTPYQWRCANRARN